MKRKETFDGRGLHLLRTSHWASSNVFVSRPMVESEDYGLCDAHTLRSAVVETLNLIEYPGTTWYVAERSGMVYLRVEAELPDNVTGGEPELQRGRPWLIRKGATEGEIVRTAWLAIETFLIHEAREKFLYKGKRVMDPHFEV